MARKKKRNTRHEDGSVGTAFGNHNPKSRHGETHPRADEVPSWLPGRELAALVHVLRQAGGLRETPAWRCPALKPLRKAVWPVAAELASIYRERGGVAGKRERKRQKLRRLESETAAQALASHNLAVAASRGGGLAAGTSARPAHGDGDDDDDQRASRRAAESIASSGAFRVALGALERLAHRERGIRAFGLAKPLKALRVALHPFVEAHIDEENGSATLRASSALIDGRMADAVAALAEVRRSGKVPKLGAVQRWVRDCMNEDEFAALGTEESVSTLDAIIRLQPVRWWWEDGAERDQPRGCPDTEQLAHVIRCSGDPLIRRMEPFQATPREVPVPTDPEEIAVGVDGEGDGEGVYRGRFGTRSREALCGSLASKFPQQSYRVVYEEKAQDRTPPNRYDLRIYKLPEGAIPADKSAEGAQSRVEVPGLPGAFVLLCALTPRECDEVIAAAESSPCGYVPDESATSAPAPKGFAPRATNFVWLSDEIADRIFARVRHLLPKRMGKNGQHELRGINARLRLYRYSPGAIYRPHVDGAWPGSGTKKEESGGETYEYDHYGDRWSRLTFLVYLNEDFGGGCTTFYTPSPREGRLEARSVEPRRGAALVFPHGGDCGSLVHEGSNVTRGAKYVIRTDVLYS